MKPMTNDVTMEVVTEIASVSAGYIREDEMKVPAVWMMLSEADPSYSPRLFARFESPRSDPRESSTIAPELGCGRATK